MGKYLRQHREATSQTVAYQSRLDTSRRQVLGLSYEGATPEFEKFEFTGSSGAVACSSMGDRAMAKDRALIWVKTKLFIGWRCHACGWERPYRRLADPGKSSKTDSRIAFDLHRCGDKNSPNP